MLVCAVRKVKTINLSGEVKTSLVKRNFPFVPVWGDNLRLRTKKICGQSRVSETACWGLPHGTQLIGVLGTTTWYPTDWGPGDYHMVPNWLGTWGLPHGSQLTGGPGDYHMITNWLGTWGLPHDTQLIGDLGTITWYPTDWGTGDYHTIPDIKWLTGDMGTTTWYPTDWGPGGYRIIPNWLGTWGLWHDTQLTWDLGTTTWYLTDWGPGEYHMIPNWLGTTTWYQLLGGTETSTWYQLNGGTGATTWYQLNGAQGLPRDKQINGAGGHPHDTLWLCCTKLEVA